MRACFVLACVFALAGLAVSQQAAGSGPAASKAGETQPAHGGDSALKEMFEAKIKGEWDALKNRDKKAYGDFLADDYIGVEVDGRGERNKIQSLNEVAELNVADYTMWGLKVTPLGPDTTFLVYEITMQFPPRAQVRYARIYIGSLWVKRGGEWKELHYQETHVK